MRLNDSKRRLCLFSLLICLVGQTQAQNSDNKHPFAIPQQQSCEQLATQRLTQINAWQYQGHIYSPQSSALMVILTNNTTWLTINSDSELPPILQPWIISQISTSHINWQVALPDYCEQQLTITMKFAR